MTPLRSPQPVRRPSQSSLFPLPSLAQFILSSWESISHTPGGFVRSWCCYESKSGRKKLRLDIGGNRWCLNKNRQHKSNHIYFIVDLWRGVFFQKCHDADCVNFLSQWFPVPPWEMEEANVIFGCYDCLLDENGGTIIIVEQSFEGISTEQYIYQVMDTKY